MIGPFFPFLGALLPLAVLGLIVFAIVAVTGGRDPDPTGRRAHAVYLFAVTFVALFVTLFAAYAAVSALLHIPFAGGESCPPGAPCPIPEPVAVASPPPPLVEGTEVVETFPDVQGFDADEEHVRQAVQSALIALAAGVVLWFHARRARDLVGEPGFKEGGALRTYRLYLYAVCFVAMLIALFAGAFAAYGLVRVVAPGVTGFGPAGVERESGLHQFLSAALLTAAAVALFLFHWRRAVPRPAEPSPAEAVTGT